MEEKRSRPGRIIVNVTNNISNDSKAISTNTNTNDNDNVNTNVNYNGGGWYVFWTYSLLVLLLLIGLSWVLNVTGLLTEDSKTFYGSYNTVHRLQEGEFPAREINGWFMTDMISVADDLYAVYGRPKYASGISAVYMTDQDRVLMLVDEKKYRVKKMLRNGYQYVLLLEKSQYRTTVISVRDLGLEIFKEERKDLLKSGAVLDFYYYDVEMGMVEFYANDACRNTDLMTDISLDVIAEDGVFYDDNLCFHRFFCSSNCSANLIDRSCLEFDKGNRYWSGKYGRQIDQTDLFDYFRAADERKCTVVEIFTDEKTLFSLDRCRAS